MRATSLGTWRLTFLASLGLLSACGQAEGDQHGSGGSSGQGSGGHDAGGDAQSGGTDALGGRSSSGGSSSGGTQAGGVTHSGGAPANLCENPTPILADDGSPTGLERCDDGLVHRPDAVACAQGLPRDLEQPVTLGECRRDSDCTAQPFGHCEIVGQIGTACRYDGCITDGDCPAGNLCQCGAQFGVCTPMACTTTADCNGQLCAHDDDPGPCADDPTPSRVGRFLCTSPGDTCRVNDDCASKRCGVGTDGNRACLERRICGVGRPFLIDGEARVAEVRGRADWLPADKAPTATLQRRAAAHYQRAAQLEHASVAAFARFTLELMALGAPAELVEGATQAMADETLHARLCFGLASRYAGRALGPGPLAMNDALGNTELETVLRNVVLEGCVGESVAAEEAVQSLEFAHDAEVRSVLARIAEDERRHAELAFRFLDWALAARPELCTLVRDLVRAELDAAAPSAASNDALDADDRRALEHGVFPDAWRPILRDSVLREFVLPCVEALCTRHGRRSRKDGIVPFAESDSPS